MADSLTRIVFQKLVTMSGDDFENGELIVDQGRIVDVRSGTNESFEGITHDWSDCLILPGFVNAHCHLSLSGLQGKVVRQERFVDWIESVVAENAALSWKDRVDALRREAQTLIESGVTALGDYFSHPELLVEYQALPFRQVLFLEILGFQSALAVEKAQSVAALLQEHPAGAGSLIQLAVAPHAPYSVSPALFKELKILADKQSCRYSCHVAEVEEETRFLSRGDGDFLEFLKKRDVYNSSWESPGVSPVRYLEQLAVLQDMVAIHLNHLEKFDLRRLAENNASAVFCPGSTRWFGRQTWMPVKDFLDKGIAVGLGTDSLASNDTLNFLHEIRLVEEMAPELHRSEILWLATVGGSQALNIEKLGLEPSQPADLIAFRFHNPGEEWWDLPFDPDRRQVDFSMISGKVVFQKSDNKGGNQ
ncbi:MAG: amidohydrolase family protein [Nitrospinota bacterium]|nr:amidohydrolase family protein [Nitrospinota bacterium]